MEDVVIATFMIFLLIITMSAMAAELLNVHGTLVYDVRVAADEIAERQHTTLAWVSGTTDGNNVYVVLYNAGTYKLAQFERWDVVLHYYTASNAYFVKWLPYRATAPTTDEWTVEGIYGDQATSTPEYYEPGIFNPGEYIRVWAAVQPPPKANSPKYFILCTTSGACVEGTFSQ